MAKTQRKTASVSDVLSGKVPATVSNGGKEKAEDFIRRRIVETAGKISQLDLLKEVGERGFDYALTSFNIAYSRYTAVMHEVNRMYSITSKKQG